MSSTSTVRNIVLIGKALFSNVINVLLEADKALRERQEFGIHKKCLDMLQQDNKQGKPACIIQPPDKRVDEFEKALKINKIPYVPFKSDALDQSVYIVPNEYVEKVQNIYNLIDSNTKTNMISTTEIDKNEKVTVTIKNSPSLLYAFDNIASSTGLTYARQTDGSHAKLFYDKKDTAIFNNTLYNAVLLNASIANKTLLAEASLEKVSFEKMRESVAQKKDFYIVSKENPNNHIFISKDLICKIQKNGLTKEVDLSKSENPIEEAYSLVQDEIGFSTSIHVEPDMFEKRNEIIAEANKAFLLSDIDIENMEMQNDIIQALNIHGQQNISKDQLINIAQGDISLCEFFQLDKNSNDEEMHFLYEKIDKINNNETTRSFAINYLSELSEEFEDITSSNNLSFGREENERDFFEIDEELN